MTQSNMFGDEPIEIKAKFNVDVTEVKRQLEALGGRLSGGAANLAGQAGAAMGFGGGGANAAGQETKSKEQGERDKVRNTALQGMAKAMPGGGLFTTMAKSFGQGGMMGGIATGITAVVGILTSIMKSSQVFQTTAGTIFKILGMMADLFLMPFVPLMMKFASWMITHMPQIQAAGEKVAGWIEQLVNIFTWGGKQEKAGKERREEGGFWNQVVGRSQQFLGETLSPGNLLRYGMPGGSMSMNQFGNTGTAGGGPRMAMGSGMVVPQNMAAEGEGFGGRVAAWIQRFNQKEMGPGGVMERWYDQMFGGSILPDIWTNIRGFFGGIETETASISKQVASATEEGDQKSFWEKLKFWEYLPGILGKVKDFFTGLGGKLKDFFTFDIPGIDLGDTANLVGACLSRAGSAIGNFFTDTLPSAAVTAKDAVVTAATTSASWVADQTGNAYNYVAPKLTTAGSAIGNFVSSTIPTWLEMLKMLL